MLWDDGVESYEGRIIFRSDRHLVVIPPGGRFDPLPLGTYTVRVVRGTESVDAGTYTVE